MINRDKGARDLRCILLSELAAAKRPLTTAELRRRINGRRETEVVLEAIYRNLCVLRDRDQIQHAGRTGRHTLWAPTNDTQRHPTTKDDDAPCIDPGGTHTDRRRQSR
jgi:hypothetical protein